MRLFTYAVLIIEFYFNFNFNFNSRKMNLTVLVTDIYVQYVYLGIQYIK